VGRSRLRDLGITIGVFPTGQYNAITDVPGVLVGHSTIVYDRPRVARTGVTIVTFREGRVYEDLAFAGYHSFNGCGEMTGLAWIEEAGILGSPIALTNTAEVGRVRDAISQYADERLDGRGYWLPVAAETYDGWLNDISALHVTKEHVFEAITSAASGPVAEGNVGGGTGMICHDFKGGIGTSSRMVEVNSGRFTVGALVQTNYGDRELLRVDGVPVGREIGPSVVPRPWDAAPFSSSIIVILACDAPLLPGQCKQLARRATIGLARAGGTGHAFSGDLFLAFATGNHLAPRTELPYEVKAVPLNQMDPFFDATAEVVEESILNALTAAESMTGYGGHTAFALPLDELKRVMAKYRPVDSRPKS
jgi:D-aminopeptidase